MIKQAITLGFDLATLPARLALRGTREMLLAPQAINQALAELRLVSDEVAREMQLLVQSVDREMAAKAAHLTPAQREQATELALQSAEQHLGMAARNVLRALWLATRPDQEMATRRGETIDQQD